jgi:hypothetical protein
MASQSLFWSNHRQPWSADDVEMMISEIRMGHDIPAVARTLGRSQEAVRQAAHRLDLMPSASRHRLALVR